MNNRLVIIVTSCDLYKDCWEPLIFSFKKYWPDCPYSIYIISNFESLRDETIKFIPVGEHKGWGTNTKKALKEIAQSNYIMHLHEDYFLCKTVETAKIEALLDHCDAENLTYLRISSNRPCRDNYRIGDSIYCDDPVGVPYSLCLQPSIWKRSFYESLCIERWSCWDLERNINGYIIENKIEVKSQAIYSEFYNDYCLPVVADTAIRKGKWTLAGAKFLKENGFDTIYKSRRHEGFITRFLININQRGVRVGPILRFFQRININI